MIILIIIGLLVLLVVSAIKVRKETNRTYEQIGELEILIHDAKTVGDVIKVYDKLKEIRVYSSRQTAVVAKLSGMVSMKYELFKELESKK